jgi:hypothetical protein
MSGANLHSPNTPSWRGAQLKDRDNFTFYLYLNKFNYRILFADISGAFHITSHR